ncbi:MAG: type II secretion system minor pseudopilin GspI [Steroidobacteraceae bacterium]|nr:type II secretion system minor pseudopilin GspI [Steroidobacteraceae bacterium]
MCANADHHRRRRPRTRGFTLIEVLAALVIVALGMLGVIQAVTQTARNGTYLREKTLAHWIAMNVITEQRLQPGPPRVTDETSDDVEFAGQRWRWTMKVTQTEVDSLRRMDVAVRPADRPDAQALVTVTGFYGTAIGAAGGGTLPWSDAGTANGGDDTEGDGEDDGGGSTNDGKPDASPQPSDGETPRRLRREPRDPAYEDAE